MMAGGPGGDAGGRKQMGSVEDRDIDDTQLQGGRAGARGPRVELSFLFFFFFFFLFWPCLKHVEVPGPGVEPVP